MEKGVLKSICWDITSRCNDQCKFCYRNEVTEELDFDSNKIILKKLIDFGVDKISFVGGEPLLYDKLLDLVSWGKKYANKKTIFSITTNAILLADYVNGEIKINERKIEELVEIFDWITFSLDAPNSEIQERVGRNSLHFERILSILQYFEDKKYSIKVKVNTVVTCINIDYMFQIYELLCNYNVKRWKVFCFLPSRGRALEYKDNYIIAKEVFGDRINELKKHTINKKIKISVNGYDVFDNSYVTISAAGKLIIYENGKYLYKVDLLKEDASNILKYIDVEKHSKNRGDFLNI